MLTASSSALPGSLHPDSGTSEHLPSLADQQRSAGQQRQPASRGREDLCPHREHAENFSECVRTKKVHLGMDEAHGLGLGEYLKKHGFTNRLSIMKRHLEKVEELCRKYGLEP